MLYWKVGYRFNIEVLKDERAEYGQSIIEDLARSLTIECGRCTAATIELGSF